MIQFQNPSFRFFSTLDHPNNPRCLQVSEIKNSFFNFFGSISWTRVLAAQNRSLGIVSIVVR